MKDDKLDIKLREKLGRMSVEPPAHVWERIEKGLAAASSAPAAEEVRAAQGRPLRRRVLSWSAAAAACLIAGAISFSVLNKQQPASPLAGNDSAKTGVVRQPSTTGSETDIAVPPGEDPTETARPQIQNRSLPPALPGPDDQPVSEEPVLIAMEEPVGVTKKDEDATQEVQQTATSDSAGTDYMKNKTSDMKQRERSVVTERELRPVAEDDPQYRARRSTPVSTSLFAANFGGMNLGGDVMGNTRVANETPGQSANAVKMRHKIPLTFGVNISYGLTDRLSVETGLLYSYLYSESETNANTEGKFEQKLHYLGIPVMVRYDIWNLGAVKVYAGVGGTIERCVSAKEINKYSYLPTEKTSLNAEGFQFSVNVAAGVQLRLDNTFGLYLEPGLNYFFDASGQPESYRTQNPLSFSVKAGLRVNLR